MIATINVLLVFCFFKVIVGDLTSVIQTNKGPVQGEILNTVLNSLPYSAFKGIPYAKPPVQNLRFKPPIEIEAWKTILNATSVGSMCPQYNSVTSSVVGSEDCLYLNVFTPHTDFNANILKPVMVWIYGGSFKTGDSNPAMYGPDFLLEEDVIVVSFNYRLGALGFLNLHHERASGNYGLKDQNLALKWVKNNIVQFGGDPDQITIFGQSAGSVSVDLQVLSDMSVGLFKQAISMSGSSLCLYWGIQSAVEAQQQAFTLGSKLGTKAVNKDHLLKILHNASAADIIEKSNDLGVVPFRPTIESTKIAVNELKFLTECTLKKYLEGNYTKGPHIMGFTSDETLLFAKSADDMLVLLNTALAVIQNAFPNYIPILSNVIDASITGKSNLTDAAIYKLIEITSDLLYYSGIDAKQRLLQFRNEFPIYYYRFSFNSNYSLHRALGINLNGVAHADDLPYIFYMPISRIPLDVPDIATTRNRLVRMWANFAKYSNPTPDGKKDKVLGVTWPQSGIKGTHLEINATLTIGPRLVDGMVLALQSAGIGASPIINDCSSGVIPTIVCNIVSVIDLLGQNM